MSDPPHPLVIFGAGTLARLALAYFTRDSPHEVVAFTVDADRIGSAELAGLPGVPFDGLVDTYPPSECSLFVAVGYTRVNQARAEIFTRSRELGYALPTIISSRADCWADLEIGLNCFVLDGVVIEPGVKIGDDVIIWSGSQVSHDNSIGHHCFLGPNAVLLGDVTLRERVFVGGNATVRDGVTVAEDCVVGAGAVIKGETVPGAIYSVAGTRATEGRHSRELVDL